VKRSSNRFAGPPLQSGKRAKHCCADQPDGIDRGGDPDYIVRERQDFDRDGFRKHAEILHRKWLGKSKEIFDPRFTLVAASLRDWATQGTSETTVLVKPAIGLPICGVMTSQIKGLGVETIGLVTTEYKGRDFSPSSH
jgi:hypothetical protein